jgi:hypothetical protein
MREAIPNETKLPFLDILSYYEYKVVERFRNVFEPVLWGSRGPLWKSVDTHISNAIYRTGGIQTIGLYRKRKGWGY